MVPIRTRTYETQKSYEDVFSRIRLQVERVANLVNPLLGNITEETNRHWVGRINSSDGTFKIVQTNSSILPLRFLEGNFFTIFIHGQVYNDKDKTTIEVDYKLGWHTTIMFLMVYLFPVFLSVEFIIQDDFDSIYGLIPWVLIFIVIPTLLLLVQLNRTEDKISYLLGSE